MNLEQYKAQRKALMDEAESLIEKGKANEANAKMEEVKKLDDKWEEVKIANANLNALKDTEVFVDLEKKSAKVKGERELEFSTKEARNVDEKKAYEKVWAKHMMGFALDQNERELFNKFNPDFQNAYTHDTTNTEVLIPETVAEGIWKRAEENYPLYADARKYNVRGKFTIKKHVSIDAGDAAWYTEGTPTEDEQNTFGELVLDGHELAKAVTVTWKLQAMAVEDFIPFITEELGDRIGAALGMAAAQGTGEGQPRGVETALLEESGTPQVVTYSEDDPLSYQHLTQAMGLIHSSYLSGAAIYANNATIWGQLANLMDNDGRPLFIPDVTSGGVGRMFGLPVKPDAGVSEGSIIIGNANRGLVFNVSEPMSVMTEQHVKSRTTDYAAYTVVDGDVIDEKAFALITEPVA
ncbi:phage major capsid protein [Thermoactinomyces intermedius]|jgi:HK97 family phage major capsid protein|uniref:Phage major capsid protein n=1 Tax=Thermoactinomyces intermedius TaxID=2024 RepID=A0A8I1A6J3_THEIN|nr:phage major capsid protein [Thermoactinomyces intermedius]MBA4549270.1 phage major capsid protein [Thermoactinomyces intermedius]MBA4836484.1 phage major capsid protein [Thermoactinomyces intermedius]MBH8595714.1 phage major capsid protein [Thermoactinomyces intermedius]